MNDELMKRILSAISANDLCGEVLWGKELTHFSIMCSDIFCWGTADCEEIESDEDIALLNQAFHDSEYHGDALYCARRRKERPQGAFYKYLTTAEAEFFDACGPKKETGIGNPHENIPGR